MAVEDYDKKDTEEEYEETEEEYEEEEVDYKEELLCSIEVIRRKRRKTRSYKQN
jgi:hypothetical protein